MIQMRTNYRTCAKENIQKYKTGPTQVVPVYLFPKCCHKNLVNPLNRVGFQKMYTQESTSLLSKWIFADTFFNKQLILSNVNIWKVKITPLKCP